jgi:hypothetical protein
VLDPSVIPFAPSGFPILGLVQSQVTSVASIGVL